MPNIWRIHSQYPAKIFQIQFQIILSWSRLLHLSLKTNTISCGPEFYNCVFQGQCDLFSEVYTPFQKAHRLGNGESQGCGPGLGQGSLGQKILLMKSTRIQLTLRVRSQSQTRGWRNPRIRSRVRLGQSRLGNTFNEKYKNSANDTRSIAVADQVVWRNPRILSRVRLGQSRLGLY